MSSLKMRAARVGVKYVVTHPRSRVTRIATRFALRRVRKRVVTSAGVEAISAVRGPRLILLAGLVAVASGAVLVMRRSKAGAVESAPSPAPPVQAPFPAAEPGAAPPEMRDAPSTSPTSRASEAAATTVDDPDHALVARVEAKLDAAALEVEANAGVVTLRGPVADEEAESRFVRDAEQVQGVKAVQSELYPVADEPGSAAS